MTGNAGPVAMLEPGTPVGPSASVHSLAPTISTRPERASEDEFQHSVEDVWFLKEITFGQGDERRRVKIVTQNFNGPCSLLAICNVLILRGSIQIEPWERENVSYEFLASLLMNYMLEQGRDFDTNILSVLPLTTKGMDLNPVFTGSTDFRPAGSRSEMSLFRDAGIELHHGWLSDPSTPEHEAISRVGDYDSAMILIATADGLTDGKLLSADELPEVGPSAGNFSGTRTVPGPSYQPRQFVGSNLTAENRKTIEDAVALRHFLDVTQSQLTYHGLFSLASNLQPGALVALFRNSHLSVLYKSQGEDASLYSLVTDHIFSNESSVVWERLEDVEGGAATFVDSDHNRSSPLGGDFAGYSAEAAMRDIDLQLSPEYRNDNALAAQLQSEEDAEAQRRYAQREEERAARQRARVPPQSNSEQRRSEQQPKKKRSCIIM